MKRIAAILLASVAAIAADVTVTLQWDANPSTDEVIAYHVRQSTNVSGPWQVIASTTNTQYVVTLPSAGRYFWFVTASNFWGESLPSNTVSTPAQAGKVEKVKVTR